MRIKILKENGFIRKNFEEGGWNVPTDLEEFKTLAVDTINWQIGDNIKKTLGNTQTNLSASNAKAIALSVKVISSLNPNLDSLTELEKDSWSKLVLLEQNGYADSQMLNTSISSVSEFIAKGTDKATRVSSATTHEEVIAVLNED